jgi:diguanylate cyclase (GGDEF)-like protein
MHRLLKRQLKKVGYGGEVLSKEELNRFIDMVNQAYIDCDEDREFLEHTLDVSSKEMHDLYVALEEKSQTKLAQSEARYKALARHDSLTGIANRYALEEELKRLIALSKREKKSFALLFMDLDHFKNINDTHGHDFGDLLLKEVVKRVLPQLRTEDIMARLGGDEFVIVLTNISEEKLVVVIEKILSLFRKPWEIEGHTLNVSTSIGVVLYPKDGEDAWELLKNADIAMYRAKEMGRDNFSFFTQELNDAIMYEMRLEEDMPKAIQNNEFELFFQPKVRVDNDEIIGAEALIRWRHPEFGLLTPKEFIPLAETNGFISKIGEWVLEESTKIIEEFNTIDTNKEMHLCINVSSKQFVYSNLYEIVHRIVKNLDNPRQLILEITESIMLEDVEFILFALQRMHDLGILLSIDDFGRGYSSLSYLTKLPIDSIKIDKLFIDQIKPELKEKTLIDTIIAMADTLEKCVVAEGVEKEYQLNYLREKGCKYYQGNYFSKPVSKEEYMKMLQKKFL